MSEALGKKPMLVLSASVLALAFTGVIIRLAYVLGLPDQSYNTNFLICLLGTLIGWGIGILATPLDNAETARFVTLGQAVSAFLSGYVVSKLDRFLEGALFSKEGVQLVAWQRLGLFAASLLTSLIISFVWRSYTHKSEEPVVESSSEPLPMD